MKVQVPIYWLCNQLGFVFICYFCIYYIYYILQDQDQRDRTTIKKIKSMENYSSSAHLCDRMNRQYSISILMVKWKNTWLHFHLCATTESFCSVNHCGKPLKRRYVCNRWEMCLKDTTRCLTTLNVSKCRTFNSFDKRTQSDLN